MEKRNQVEKGIKEKLEHRIIEPSSDLWLRIEGALERVDAIEKKRKPAPWMLIAASIMMLFGGSYFFLFATAEKTPISVIEQIQDSPQVGTTIHNRIEKKDRIEKEERPAISKTAVVEHSSVDEKSEPMLEKKLESKEVNVALFKSEHKRESSNLEDHYNLDEVTALALEKTNTNNFKIDPNALLKDVESELKVEYRETVFEQLKRNFKEAKTNFANRNYE